MLLVVDVEFHGALASSGERVEVGWECDAGYFALEVGGVAGADRRCRQSGSSISFTLTFRVGATGITAATDLVS